MDAIWPRPLDALWPRPLDALDRLLGADPEGTAAGATGYFLPELPQPNVVDAALRARYDERWAEYWGPIGDRIRVLEADGVITVDPLTRAVHDAATKRALDGPIGADA